MDNSVESKPPLSVIDDEQEQRGEIVELNEEDTAKEEKAVLRKIDMVILPFMCFTFFLQYLDKQSLSYAAVFNLMDDLNMISSQYSWCSYVFYVGQLVSEYPFIYLMSRLQLTKFVGATVIIWGIICMCLAAPTNYAGFAAVRFFLGLPCRLPSSPSRPSDTARRSTRLRTALWVTMNGVAQVVSCLLITLTTVAGVAFFVLMPTGPRDAWFLTPREKVVLSLRMAQDREGGDKTSFSLEQLCETMLDPKAWAIFWFGVLSPVLSFASLVIKSIGYSQLDTMLYTAPSGAVQIFVLWIGVAFCHFLPRQRTLVVLVLIIPPLIGNVFLMKLDVTTGWGLIIASWLASCITASMSILLSLSASNVKGNTKRSITQRPRYQEGVITVIVTWCLLFVAVVAYRRAMCMRDNKQRDEQASSGLGNAAREVVLDKHGAPKSDLTDKKDREFRYSW
ncbi:hypothetical protein QQZ08_011706 [Neonectria magnoliae]|uniref:Uncharacterized protein n=1 Tax=Neonectria magnoliae TaxID=2732573 RepID=A0ABR1H8N7_9HYPO